MNLVWKKGSILALPALGLCSLLAGCGDSTPTDQTGAQLQAASTPETQNHTRRFTQSQIDAVFTNDTVGGVPVLREPLVETYTSPSQAPDLVEELGDFTVAAEFWGYLNLASAPGSLSKARFALTFEAVSQWTQTGDSTGDFLFQDAYTTDASGRRIPDELDGVISGGDESRFARTRMNVAIATLTIDLGVRMVDAGNRLETHLVNVRPVSAPLVGRIIDTGNFKTKFELYPYRGGYLAYGSTAATLEKLQDRFDPEKLVAQVESMYRYLHTKLIGN